MKPVLRATLFDTFRLQLPDGVEIEISGKRSRALLAIICLTPGVPIERARLCELLWQGRFQAQARASLRQTVLGLKKQFASIRPDFLEITRDSIAVNASAVQTDLAELESCLASGDHEKASECLTEIGNKKLLARKSFGDEFEQWLAIRQEQIEQRLRYAVEGALAELQRTGNDGEHARLQDAWRFRHSAAAAQSQIRIGVLPFGVIEDQEQDQKQRTSAASPSKILSQGLFNELITALGQLPQLLIAGRGSSLSLTGSEKPVSELARALGVDYLIQGSIHHQGENARAHVCLVDGKTGFERWSQSYPGQSENLFALQDDIVRSALQAITRELDLDLSLSGQRISAGRTTNNRAAYELYLQGRALTARAIGDGLLPKAIELLEAALALDPDFAACWTALAEAHVYTAVFTPCLDRLAQSQKMADCASRAIELDPDQGHARTMLGIHRWTENDPVGALDLAHEAYRLEPNNPDVVLRLGSFLLYIGRTREALPYVQAAVDQDPVNGRNYAMLSVAQLNLGNFDAAIEAGQRMADLGLPSMWLGVATAASGDRKRAVDQYRQTMKLLNKTMFPPAGSKPLSGPALYVFWQIAARGVCSGNAVHRKLYCALLDQLHATLHDPCDTSIVQPAIWMGYGEMVVKTLGKQITPANMLCLMSLWADIEPIRSVRLHPNFMPFAKRIGLFDAWEKYGWPDLLAKT